MSNNKTGIISLYKNRIETFRIKHAEAYALSSKFSYARLGLIILFIPIIYFSLQLHYLATIVSILLLVSFFIFAVNRQQFHESRSRRFQNLLLINENEINCLSDFKNQYYNGKKFEDPKHLFSEDLDIFGESSLFSLVNRAQTFQGVKNLGNCFVRRPAKAEIDLYMEAIMEMEPKLEWRQTFQELLFELEGGHEKDYVKEIDEALNFETDFANKKWLRNLIRLLPVYWILVFSIYFFNVQLANIILSASFISVILFVISKAKQVGMVQSRLSYANIQLKALSKSLMLIFSEQWESELINTHQVMDEDDKSEKLNVLKDLWRIIDHLDYRLNFMVAIFLNGFFMWDLIMILRIHKWKSNHQGKLIELFDLIGLMESLSSLSNWAYNHPDYNYAKIDEDYLSMKSKGIKHPLIRDEENVPNDFEIDKTHHLTIVTGSNMSGKSTFLRTLGINMVLGYSGTKVAAVEFRFPVSVIVTYMRIKDVLEENVSTFKAELNRISIILSFLKRGELCFLLIDEMLRGTNSRDKLRGSMAIAQKLLDEKTYAIVATHDIQLAEMGEENSQVQNYFFDIDYSDGDLVFDYKLKPGICENFNASFLLEKLGLEMKKD